MMLKRDYPHLSVDIYLEFPEPKTSTTVSKIASKLMDAGGRVTSSDTTTASSLTLGDLDYLRSKGASIDDRFREPPRMSLSLSWSSRLLGKISLDKIPIFSQLGYKGQSRLGAGQY
jgi:hypothetical protein